MSKHKKPETSLGKSLMRRKKKVPKIKEARFEHIEIVKEDHTKLQSIIEQNALSEFLQEAELSSKKFEVLPFFIYI
jgi:hypothetical protein